MTASKEKQLDQRQRLMEMREHLRLRAAPDDPSFEREVVAAGVRQVQPIIDAYASRTGEEIGAIIATQLGILFEEVRTPADIRTLERTQRRRNSSTKSSLAEKESSLANIAALRRAKARPIRRTQKSAPTICERLRRRRQMPADRSIQRYRLSGVLNS